MCKQIQSKDSELSAPTPRATTRAHAAVRSASDAREEVRGDDDRGRRALGDDHHHVDASTGLDLPGHAHAPEASADTGSRLFTAI